jgi:DNA-3-methyladenine glycosylase II
VVVSATKRLSYSAAAQILAAQDSVLARLIEDAGPMRLPRARLSPFGALVQAIVYQQLAGAAARAIHGRLVDAMGGEGTPDALLALSDKTLRAVGLSAAKVRSLRDLATKVVDGTVVVSPRRLARQSAEEVTRRLTTVYGIGPWSADMFLIFQLRRLDVWPVGDFGVRNGYGLIWKVPMPTASELVPLGERFRPYRTVVACYCWRAVELYAGRADSAVKR